jgi:hypothetical protein
VRVNILSLIGPKIICVLCVRVNILSIIGPKISCVFCVRVNIPIFSCVLSMYSNELYTLYDEVDKVKVIKNRKIELAGTPL